VAPRAELASGEGAFRSGFLQALAEIVVNVNSSQPAIQRFGRRVVRAASNVSHVLGRHVALQLGLELLTYIPGGASAGSVALEAAEAAIGSSRDDIGTRLTEANSGVVADTLAALAGEVSRYAEVPVILVLDSGERLSDVDLRTLTDSIRRLPVGVSVWMGFATRDDGERDACTSLIQELQGKASELEVSPLAKAAVGEWLLDAGLEGTDVGEVMRWSGGYPMLVGDVVAELQRGVPIDQLPLNRQFVVRSEANLKRLGEGAHTAARRLATLPNRPTDETLREIVGVDANRWAQLVAELQDARIFTQLVDGGPWFHEQRRQFIKSGLSPAEARESRRKALPAVRNQFERNLYAFRIAKAQTDIRLLTQIQSELGEGQGEIALLNGRLFRALGDYRQALEFLEEPIRDPRDWVDVEVETAHNRAEILRLSGRYEQALSLWDRLETYGRSHEDLVAQARAAWGRSLTYKLIDAAREAIELCDRVDRLREEARRGKGRIRSGVDPNTEARRGHLSRHKAELYCYIGDYVSAAQECARGFSFYEKEQGSPSWWELTAVEAQLLRLEGDFSTSLDRAKEAQQGFRRDDFGWRRGSVTILRHLAQSEMSRDLGEAARVWKRLLEVDAHLYPHAPIYAHLGLGECARIEGTTEDALSHYAEAERLTKHLYAREGSRLVDRFGYGREWAYVLLSRATCLIASAEESQASNLASEALSYARARRVPWLEFWSQWLLARSSQSEKDRNGYVEQVRKASAGFRRRPGDADLEALAIVALARPGEVEPTSSPFNFP
jgi:tetratricopeptide (TPR) repeat protein